MLALQKLLSIRTAALSTPKESALGVWRLARLQLDPATGEQLNVGVVLRDQDTGATHLRFLHNVGALRCLYNDNLADDAAFLIDQAEQALEAGLELPTDWNIVLSEPLTVRGPDTQHILDDLFTRMVPLGAKEGQAERLDTDDHPHATRNVRATVRKLLSKHLQTKKAPDFWRSSPIDAMQDGHRVKLDIQIESTTRGNSRLHGTIASAWYKSNYHRGAYLDKAARAMTTVSELYANSTNVVYLLKPTGDHGFTRKELDTIEADIDTMRWLVGKKCARLAEFSSENNMVQNILEDVGEI